MWGDLRPVSFVCRIICSTNDCRRAVNLRTSQEMATSPSTDTEFAEFAGQLFFRLWRVSHTRVAEALGSVGLTPALFGLLNVLGAREGANQQEIGSAMGIDPSTMVS